MHTIPSELLRSSIADIFTKALPRVAFQRLRVKLGIKDLSAKVDRH
jgi:hypothetical protein